MKSLLLIFSLFIASVAHAQTPVVGGGTSTVGGVSGSLVASAQLLAQTANVTPQLLYAVPVGKAGWYAAVGYNVITVPAQTSGTLPSGVVIWTELDTGTSANGSLGGTITSNTVGVTNVAGNIQNVKYIRVAQNSNINLQTTGYASVGAPALQYNVYMKLYYVGP